MATCANMLMLQIILLLASLPALALVLGGSLFALFYGEFWTVFLSVVIIGSSVLVVLLAVLIGMTVCIALVSPRAAWLTWTRSPLPQAIAPLGTPTSMLPIQVDENMGISRIGWYTKELPPALYIDDYTVVQEISDLSKLREGDHCIVGLNLMPQFSQTIDAFISRLTSWDAAPVRVFHHFIILDSVDKVSLVDGPLRADGGSVRIAEFSETLPGAIARIIADGYHPRQLLSNLVGLLASPARYHVASLVDYLPPSRRRGCRGNGIFLIQQTLSEEKRRKICEQALALPHAPDMPVYDPFTANCEHACFVLSAEGRWISPQVSHLAWTLVRILLQCVGIPCLVGLTASPRFVGPTLWHGLHAALFHLFSTFVVMSAVQMQLVRTVYHLTQQRRALGHMAFSYLITKETLRAVIVGGLSTGTLALMPKMVWSTGLLRLACAVSLSIYMCTSTMFNISHQLVIRFLLRAGVGIPVPIFQDLRDTQGLYASTEFDSPLHVQKNVAEEIDMENVRGLPSVSKAAQSSVSGSHVRRRRRFYSQDENSGKHVCESREKRSRSVEGFLRSGILQESNLAVR